MGKVPLLSSFPWVPQGPAAFGGPVAAALQSPLHPGFEDGVVTSGGARWSSNGAAKAPWGKQRDALAAGSFLPPRAGAGMGRDRGAF